MNKKGEGGIFLFLSLILMLSPDFIVDFLWPIYVVLPSRLLVLVFRDPICNVVIFFLPFYGYLLLAAFSPLFICSVCCCFVIPV